MSEYSASSIRVLKDLEPVKERPGMYTRTTCPTHIVQEVIDNAADEALAGFAKKINVSIRADGLIEVSDNGRGIPVEIHPEEGKPAVELVFSKLHAGGKFNKKESGNAYRFSGGLHGVGVSVTNALSSRLEVEVKRGGGVHRMAFEHGFVVEPLERVGDCGQRNTGTTVRIQPDPKYFDSPKVNLAQLEHLLRSKAVLMPNLAVTLEVEGQDRKEWCYQNGMADYLTEMMPGQPIVPIFVGEKTIEEPNGFAVGEGAAWALAWFEEGGGKPESYVNLIPTLDGGTHEAGLKAGVFEAVKSFADHHAILPAKVKLAQEDVTGRMTFLLSAKVLDPQFQGQTKEKLTSRDAYKLVSQMVRDPFELWLNSHAEYGKKIAELAVKAAQNRMKSAQKVEKKKSSGIATLPGKLTDCESEDISRNEVFLVEGDSAGGSAKQGRDKETQAVLPLRGKVLNTWEVDRDQLFKNNEVHDISVAIGVDPHGLDAIDTVDVSGLRYGRIIVMSDADVDGSHIQVLLFTLFLRHFPALIEKGHIYVAQPPLFRVDVEARGHTRKVYCLDEDEKAQTLQKLKDEKVPENKITVSRFKGLGEMNPDQLWETTLCPDTRRLVPFSAPREVIREMAETFNLLMGKGEAAARRAWMERDGGLVEADV
ncbi:MAG: DNA topoisomerase IV subunit B [Actinomycetota bacterium]